MPSRHGSCHDEWYAAAACSGGDDTASRKRPLGACPAAQTIDRTRAATIYVTNRRGSQPRRERGYRCYARASRWKRPSEIVLSNELSYWAIRFVQMTRRDTTKSRPRDRWKLSGEDANLIVS